MTNIAHALEKLASDQRVAPEKARQALDDLYDGAEKVATTDLKLLCDLTGTSPVDLLEEVKGFQARTELLRNILQGHEWSQAAFEMVERESDLIRHDIETAVLLAEREQTRRRLEEARESAKTTVIDATREVRECLRDAPADVLAAANDFAQIASVRARDEAVRLAGHRTKLSIAESRELEEWEALRSALKQAIQRYTPRRAEQMRQARRYSNPLTEGLGAIEGIISLSQRLESQRKLVVDLREKLATTVDDDAERLFARLMTIRRQHRY